MIGKSQTYLGEIYDCLEIEKGRREARHDRQIRECLKILGWEKSGERPYINGCRYWTWIKIRDKNNNSSGLLDHEEQNIDYTSNTDGPVDGPPVVHYQSTTTNHTEQLSVFNGPVESPRQVGNKVVDHLKDSPGKEYSQDGPVVHQKIENKKKIIPLDSSFDKNKNRSMKITGITGKWDVSYSVSQNYIHIEYVSPDKRRGQEPEFIEIWERLTYKHFRGKVESAIWELERKLISDRSFRVKVWSRNINELEPKWIDGCKLMSVPDLPGTTTFVFASPDGRFIPKFAIDEFELIEE